METPATKKSLWQPVGLLAAIAVLFCFFIPWVELSLPGGTLLSLVKINMSGWQLATGDWPMGFNVLTLPSLLLIPLGMLAVVLLVGALMAVQRLPVEIRARQVALLLLAAGGLSLLVQAYQYYNLSGQFNRGLSGLVAQSLVSFTFGWMVTFAGSIAVLAAGVMQLREANVTAQPPTAPPVASWME